MFQNKKVLQLYKKHKAEARKLLLKEKPTCIDVFFFRKKEIILYCNIFSHLFIYSQSTSLLKVRA